MNANTENPKTNDHDDTRDDKEVPICSAGRPIFFKFQIDPSHFFRNFHWKHYIPLYEWHFLTNVLRRYNLYRLHQPMIDPDPSMSTHPRNISISSNQNTTFASKLWNLFMSLDGRDKILKLVQYTSRFLVYYYQSKLQQSYHPHSYHNTMKKYQQLLQEISHARSVFGLGNFFLPLETFRNSFFRRSFLSHSPLDQNKASSSSLTTLAFSSTSFSWIKQVFLLIHWISDHLSYLYSIGFLSNHPHSNPTRQLQATQLANQSFFLVALLQFSSSWKEWNTCRKQIVQTHNLSWNPTILEDLQLQYISTCIHLIKNVCDVLIFSNNTGVDLHSKFRRDQKKMNEGFHSFCGILSAVCSLYAPFITNKDNKDLVVPFPLKKDEEKVPRNGIT